jgi:hypothetical protein
MKVAHLRVLQEGLDSVEGFIDRPVIYNQYLKILMRLV